MEEQFTTPSEPNEEQTEQKQKHIKRPRYAAHARLACLILAIAFAVAAVCCIVAFVINKHSVLFIPMSLFAVFSVVLFTYAFFIKG